MTVNIIYNDNGLGERITVTTNNRVLTRVRAFCVGSGGMEGALPEEACAST